MPTLACTRLLRSRWLTVQSHKTTDAGWNGSCCIPVGTELPSCINHFNAISTITQIRLPTHFMRQYWAICHCWTHGVASVTFRALFYSSYVSTLNDILSRIINPFPTCIRSAQTAHRTSHIGDVPSFCSSMMSIALRIVGIGISQPFCGQIVRWQQLHADRCQVLDVVRTLVVRVYRFDEAAVDTALSSDRSSACHAFGYVFHLSVFFVRNVSTPLAVVVKCSFSSFNSRIDNCLRPCIIFLPVLSHWPTEIF